MAKPPLFSFVEARPLFHWKVVLFQKGTHISEGDWRNGRYRMEERIKVAEKGVLTGNGL